MWLGHTWTLAILVPLAVVGAVPRSRCVLYPFVEEWVTGDHRDHNILDRPRNTPTRTGIGVAGIVFYGALWGAGSADLVATHFHLGVETVVAFYQALVVLGPIVAFVVTRRVCLALQKKDSRSCCTATRPGGSCACPAASTSRCTNRSTRTNAGVW